MPLGGSLLTSNGGKAAVAAIWNHTRTRSHCSTVLHVTQMPTVLLPLSTDGASQALVLRPITTSDFMTVRFDRLPTAYLVDVRDQLMQLDGIEAVFYDVTHKPPGTVEWE